jgi:hypothetical protein
MQVSTMMSLLTPKYQQYLAQETYHQGNTNVAHWQSQYCWPEGFMRRWHAAAVRDHYITVTPQQVQIMTGVARNFITNILIGREFNMEGATPRLGADVPRWYGETIGFWDEDTLITWTANVIGWKVHAGFEYSNKMQTIEIYSPNRDASGNFVGLNHEAIFYDEDALVEPIRIVRNFQKVGELTEDAPYVFIDCVQTIYPINGIATPVTPGTVFEFEQLDMYGRPWGYLWEKYNEQHMERPEEEDIFSVEPLRSRRREAASRLHGKPIEHEIHERERTQAAEHDSAAEQLVRLVDVGGRDLEVLVETDAVDEVVERRVEVESPGAVQRAIPGDPQILDAEQIHRSLVRRSRDLVADEDLVETVAAGYPEPSDEGRVARRVGPPVTGSRVVVVPNR